MISTVELNQIDVRYEHLRIKDSRREKVLQSSILEQGILDPLYVVGLPSRSHVLLDGFKRYRCAVKLKLSDIPVVTLDTDEALGILKFIRLSASKGLNAFEEASLVDELHKTHGLDTREIARRLERSASWVSARRGLLAEMSDMVRQKIFSGQFPIRNYMYTLRPYTRVDRLSKKAVEKFVECVSGQHLSTRDIELLAGGYFKGGNVLKAQIQEGNLDWTLRQLKENALEKKIPPDSLGEPESRVLSNLEILYAYITRLNHGLLDDRLTGQDFFKQSRKAANKILKVWENFHTTLQDFYGKTGKERDRSKVA